MKKIVIADDNVELCELVGTVLNKDGHNVDSVHNGYELIAYLEEYTPQVIILDIVMPGKSGISVFNTIKRISPSSRIIIYSGYQSYCDSVYVRLADRFVVKETDLGELVKAVNDLD